MFPFYFIFSFLKEFKSRETARSSGLLAICKWTFGWLSLEEEEKQLWRYIFFFFFTNESCFTWRASPFVPLSSSCSGTFRVQIWPNLVKSVEKQFQKAPYSRHKNETKNEKKIRIYKDEMVMIAIRARSTRKWHLSQQYITCKALSLCIYIQ